METPLNEKVNRFFKTYQLDDINKQNVQKYFSDLKEKNEYGGILHAMVQNQYDEEKFFVTLKILLDLGIDVNLKASQTGYTFIHLALYGYTKDDNDYSYSTEFILKIINEALKYGFDVNIVDDDSDTIIHTALASEVYNGKTLPLITALGDNFNLKAKDNQNHNIVEALANYRIEAARLSNQKWLSRLISEEEKIKQLFKEENNQQKLNETNFKLENIKIQFNEISQILSTEYLLENYENIKKLISELDNLLKIRKSLTNEQPIYVDLKDKLLEHLQKIISNYLEKLIAQPNLNKIDQLFPILNELSFSLELEKLTKTKNDYLKQIDKVKKDIEMSENLNNLEIIKSKINNFTDEEVKESLLNCLETKHHHFTDLINNINKTIKCINIIAIWNKDNFKIEYSQEALVDNLNDKSLEELTILNQEKLEEFQKLKDQSLSLIKNNLKRIIMTAFLLTDQGIFEPQEIDNVISDVLHPKIKSKHKKVKYD